MTNLARLEAIPGMFGKWGFADSVNVQTDFVSPAYLSLDQGMIMAALGNALGDDVLRRAFATPDMRRALRPVLGVEEFNVEPRACTITGTRRDDRLRGSFGRDVICGLGGDDRITGLFGADVVYGDAGTTASRATWAPTRSTAATATTGSRAGSAPTCWRAARDTTGSTAGSAPTTWSRAGTREPARRARRSAPSGSSPGPPPARSRARAPSPRAPA